MQVLALNPGSSSLRFQVVSLRRAGTRKEATRLGGGSVAGIGERPTARTRLPGEPPAVAPVRAVKHVDALDWALAWLEERALRYDAVGVRVVHGGGSRDAATRVDEELLARLRRWCSEAPLHDQRSLDVIERLRARPGTSAPLFAAFDTAFHVDLPEVARTYALPRELAERHGIRRLGFHGLALASVVEKLASLAEQPVRSLVALHLGSGASVTAVRDGRSVDTSMGFTPLEGLVMATRSGDLDPALVPWLARAEGCSPEEVLRVLNLSSGLLGVSGCTGDMQEIERLRAQGDRRATLAFDLFVHRARRHLGAAAASLGGADTVAFSGGIGEHSSAVRAAILAGMEWCGILLDPERNASGAGDRRISRDGSPVAVHVVGVDEETQIARAAAECAG